MHGPLRMSFSDFSSSRRAVGAQPAAVAAAPGSGGSAGAARGDVLAQISDVLLQYQVSGLVELKIECSRGLTGSRNERNSARLLALRSALDSTHPCLCYNFAAPSIAQRNVGILEKIVQSLLAARGDDELTLQYRAQVDVIGQLQAKLVRQLQQSRATVAAPKAAALTKLQRDFERVQARANAIQQNVAKTDLLRTTGSGKVTSVSSRTTTTVVSRDGTQIDSYQQIQVQMQHDVSV